MKAVDRRENTEDLEIELISISERGCLIAYRGKEFSSLYEFVDAAEREALYDLIRALIRRD